MGKKVLNEETSAFFDLKSAVTASYASIKTSGYNRKEAETYYVRGGRGSTGTKYVELPNTTSRVMKDVLKSQDGSLKGEPTEFAKQAIAFIDDNFDECNAFYDTFYSYVEGLDDKTNYNNKLKSVVLSGSSEIDSKDFGVLASGVNSAIKEQAFRKIDADMNDKINVADFKPEESKFLGEVGETVKVDVASVAHKRQLSNGNNVLEGFDKNGNKFALFARNGEYPEDLSAVKNLTGKIYRLSNVDKYNDRLTTVLVNVVFDKDLSGLPKAGDKVHVEVDTVDVIGPYSSDYGEYYEVAFKGKDGNTYNWRISNEEKAWDIKSGALKLDTIDASVKSVYRDTVNLNGRGLLVNGKALASYTSTAEIDRRRREEEAAKKNAEETAKAEETARMLTKKYGFEVEPQRHAVASFDDKEFTQPSGDDEAETWKELNDGTMLCFGRSYKRMSDWDAYGESISIHDKETGYQLDRLDHYNSNVIPYKDVFDRIDSLEDFKKFNKMLDDRYKHKEQVAKDNKMDKDEAKKLVRSGEAKSVEHKDVKDEVPVCTWTEMHEFVDDTYALYQLDDGSYVYTVESYNVGD